MLAIICEIKLMQLNISTCKPDEPKDNDILACKFERSIHLQVNLRKMVLILGFLETSPIRIANQHQSV